MATADGALATRAVWDHSIGAKTPPIESSSPEKVGTIRISPEEAANLTSFVTLRLEIARGNETSKETRLAQRTDKAIETLNNISKDIAENIRETTPQSLKEEVAEIEKKTRIRDGKTETPKTKSEGFFGLLGRIFSCFFFCFGKRK